MMMHKHYLLSETPERTAFLAGCRAMIEVLQHVHPEDYPAILARQDADWIMYICDREKTRQDNEARKVAQNLVKHYSVDRTRLRGMLLDRARVNDDGRDIDDNGRVSGPRRYPRCYWSTDGIEINAEDFARLTPEQQARYEADAKIELRSKTGSQVRYISAYNRAVIEELINEMLPHEPPVILKMYRQALEDTDNDIIQTYRDCFTNVSRSNNLGSRRLDFDFESWLSDYRSAKKITSSQR